MITELLNIADSFIKQVKNKAEETSIENLKLILAEIERNPESLIYNDLKIMYTIYKKELELKLSKIKHEKTLAKSKNKSFEYGGALLQIAIILVSTSIIAAMSGLLLGGILVGSLGMAAVLNGFVLFFTI